MLKISRGSVQKNFFLLREKKTRVPPTQLYPAANANGGDRTPCEFLSVSELMDFLWIAELKVLVEVDFNNAA